MKALKISLLVFTLGLLGLPLVAAAHGGYGYYAPPPAYGYVPAPVYRSPYGPRPFVVKPYAYGYDRRYGGGGYYAPPRHGYRRHHGWQDDRGGYGGWNGGPYGGGYSRGPRSGFSLYFSD
jgi:hypothetical protein